MANLILHNQDCIEVMTSIEENSVDLILTDPPYNLGNFMRDRDTNLKKMRDNFFGSAGWDDLSFEEWEESMDSFFEESVRVLKHGGSMIVFMAIIKVDSIIKIAERRGDKPRHATARNNRKTHTTDNGYNRTNIHQTTSQIKKGHDTSNDMP